MNSSNIIAGLDIGTTKICAVISEITEDDELEIIGIGLSPSSGLKKGIVVDIEKTSQAINEAVKKAERMAGREIDSAYVGIAGAHVSSVNSHGVVAVTGKNKEIDRNDVERVLEASKVIPLSAEEEIIHVVPREFIIDGCEGIKDPLGMSGVRLEVDTHIVTGSTASIQNLVKSVMRTNLEVQELVLEPMASSKAVLSEDEKELGAALADVGGGTTDIIVYHEGSITYTSVLPVGGNHVSNDIAVGLRTPVSEAEKIKIRYGSTVSDEVSQDEYINVMAASGLKENKISRKKLSQVIEPRTREIFKMIKKELADAGARDLIPAGLVLTGGASLLEGTEKLAAEVINLPVRCGSPDYINGLSDVIENPVYEKKGDSVPQAIFSTSVGILQYGREASSNNTTGLGRKEKSKETVNNFFKKLKNWFNDFF